MGITASFTEPLFTGSSTSSDVPSKYPIALAGHPYVPDTASDQFNDASIPLARAQADQSAEPGEQSVNREGLWRRSQTSWHHGAGQRYLDREDSDRARFRASKGVDPWERWELSLLPATDSKLAVTATAPLLAVAGDYLYAADGTALRYTEDVTVVSPSWIDLTGEPATVASSMASDGYTVYTAHGADGVYSTTRGAASTGSYNTTAATLVDYVKGRLMVAFGNVITNITGGAAQAIVLTHPNTDFTWVGFAEGAATIYAAGFSGDKSLVYRTAVKPDGTALDVATVAGELPDGEVVRAIEGYLNFVLLGTDRGIRIAVPDDAGDLTIGALIDLDVPVRCFEGQGRFAWFGWSDYDDDSTGLGRLDHSVLNDSAPAYASDLMAATQGAVTAVVTFQGRRVFAVAESAVYAEEATRVASGYLDAGQITYGIADAKTAVYLDVRHEPLAGSVSASVAADGAALVDIGSSTIAETTATTLPVGQRVGEAFEVRLTLARGSDTTTTPVVTGYTLRANPAATTGEFIFVPVLLAKVVKWKGKERAQDPEAELAFLKSLRSSRQIVTYQTGTLTYVVTLEDYEFRPRYTDDWELAGTMTLKLKTLE